MFDVGSYTSYTQKNERYVIYIAAQVQQKLCRIIHYAFSAASMIAL